MELCKNCHGGSCRRYNPYLWGSDIIRICEALNVDISFFTYAFQLKGEQIEEYTGKEPIFIFTDNGSEEYFVLCLKMEESKLYAGSLKCMFLNEWSAVAQGSEELTGIIGRCGIYGIRPTNCAAWPVGYDEKRKSVILKDPHLVLEKKHKKASNSPAYNLCCRELRPADYANFRESYTKNAILNHHEKSFFMKVARKWNENPRPSDSLYEFIKNEYNNRIEHIKE